MRRSVAELETLSTYPEPDGLHAKRRASLQSQAQAAQSSSCQLHQELKQVLWAVHASYGMVLNNPMQASTKELRLNNGAGALTGDLNNCRGTPCSGLSAGRQLEEFYSFA